jgi:serine protease AprX
VIRAVDWVLAHSAEYNIRVVNLSLQEAGPSSFVFDPLDRAVERLWQSGIVVVSSAGNYAVDGAESGVLYAPGNDPFVITVGALDVNRNHDTKDDRGAPWSAYGYTEDGFRKPELAAPGRYLIGGAPIGSVLSLNGGQNPKLVKDSLLQLSGTSFAAPLVSGAAAALLGQHPEWTPDQVKGALMLSASALPSISNWAGGVGELNLKTAVGVKTPPNPNAALNEFLIDDPDGGPTRVFDGSRWIAAVAQGLTPSLSASISASWGSASWGSASWGSASWGSASWGSASWGSVAWSAASWGSASWGSTFSGVTYVPPVMQDAIADYAKQDGNGAG